MDPLVEAEEGSGDDDGGDDDGGDTAAEEEDVLNAMDYDNVAGWEDEEEEGGKGFIDFQLKLLQHFVVTTLIKRQVLFFLKGLLTRDYRVLSNNYTFCLLS